MPLAAATKYCTHQSNYQTNATTVLANSEMQIFVPSGGRCFFSGVFNLEISGLGTGFIFFNSLSAAPGDYSENWLSSQPALKIQQAANNAGATVFQEPGASGTGWAVYLTGFLNAAADTTINVQFAMDVASGGDVTLYMGSFLNFSIL